MKVALVIPWRPQPDRVEAYDFVLDHYSALMPDAEILSVDTDHEEFNLAAVRNDGMRRAENLGADVAVLVDADCIICPHSSMESAIEAARSDGKIHLPFKSQHYLSASETDLFMAHEVVRPAKSGQGQGACYVATPEAYWRAGGSDERFSGWGGEDQGFIAAAMALVGVVRHTGHAVSLWHESVRDIGSERWKPNSDLAQRYWNAKGNPEMIQSIINERQV